MGKERDLDSEFRGRSKIEEMAIRMARARRQRLDAKRYLNGPWKPGEAAARTDSKIDQAKHELSAARIEWRKCSATLWRLVERADRGLA